MPRKGNSIYKRNDGRYEGRYMVPRDENGKARYKRLSMGIVRTKYGQNIITVLKCFRHFSPYTVDYGRMKSVACHVMI